MQSHHRGNIFGRLVSTSVPVSYEAMIRTPYGSQPVSNARACPIAWGARCRQRPLPEIVADGHSRRLDFETRPPWPPVLQSETSPLTHPEVKSWLSNPGPRSCSRKTV